MLNCWLRPVVRSRSIRNSIALAWGPSGDRQSVLGSDFTRSASRRRGWLGFGFSGRSSRSPSNQSSAAQRLVKSGCVAIRARTSVIASINLSGESSKPH